MTAPAPKKKNTWLIVSVIIAAVLVVGVVVAIILTSGVGGAGKLDGNYTLTGMTVGGEDYSEYLSFLGDVRLTIDGDKAEMEMYGETVALKMDTEALTLTSEDGISQSFTVEGNKIIMTENDTTMVFERQE